jgi:hypothetical protein
MLTELTIQRDDNPPLLQRACAPWALGQVTIDCGTKARRQRVAEMVGDHLDELAAGDVAEPDGRQASTPV